MLGVAVNGSGAGGVAAGTFYVVHSSGGQSRVQRFSPSGAFERAWGWNVLGHNEIQSLTLSGVATTNPSNGGTFTLSFDSFTTSPIAVSRTGQQSFAPEAAAVQSALEVLPSIGAGNVTVTASPYFGPGPYRIEFSGALAGTDVSQITADSSQLIGDDPLANPSAVVSTVETGAGGSAQGFEICTVAALCNRGESEQSTENGGAMRAGGLAVNQSSGHVYVSDRDNVRVQEFDADGNFIRLWGWDVIVSGRPNDVGVGFEICDTTAVTPNVTTDCKNGAGGANGGQFGQFGRIGPPAIDSSDHIWITDAGNSRLQEFDSSGNFIAAYGFNVNNGGALEKCTSTAVGVCGPGTEGSAAGQFGSPRGLSFDSSGNVYVLDSGNKRVQKFNPELTAATTFGATTFLAYTSLVPEHVVAMEGGTRLFFSIRNNIFGEGEGQVLELDPADASVEDTSLIGSGIKSGFEGPIGGIAINDATGDLFVTSDSADSPRPVLVLADAPLPDPVVTVDPVTVKTDSTATLSGAVDPNGGWVECAFEYSTDQESWTDIDVPDCASLANGGGEQELSVNATGLEPGTLYHVRLAVSRPLVPGSTKIASTQFETASVAPSISSVGAIQETGTSVRLVAMIDPRKSNTQYVFEYGTTASLGLSTTPVSIGAGVTPVTVSQVVSGLSPSTVYFFRLTATNLTGTASSPNQTFTTRANPAPLPDNRAYEQVSPPDKNGGGALSGGNTATVAWDGQAVQFQTTSIFGDPPSVQSFTNAPYISRRTPSGWETRPPVPFMCRTNPDDTVGIGLFAMHFMYSPNLDKVALTHPESESCTIPPLDPTAPLPSANLYLADLVADPVSYSLLAPEPGPVRSYVARSGDPISYSEQFNHIVYDSRSPQTPDGPPAGGPDSALWSVYEWDDGTLRLVSKDPSGNAFTDGAMAATSPSLPGEGISADGNRIFFQNPTSALNGCVDSNPCELYMREDGTATYHVSQSECTSSCGESRHDLFRATSADGSRVLFTSYGKLTDDHKVGLDLYMYTQSANPAADQNLTLISHDQEPADGPGAGMRGILGASRDLETVFFVANGQIVAGAPTSSGPKLYRWHWNGGSPTVEYLAALDASDQFQWIFEFEVPESHVTPDGKYLLLDSILRLDPVADQDGSIDLYRWDQEQEWVCISCQEPGAPSGGNAAGPSTLPGAASSRPRITDDGQRIFFTTPEGMVPEDVNDTVRDVYEWHEGTISLISSGTDQQDVKLLGFSRTGEDVFFYTEVRLVGWDIDSIGDIYDARIDGGFPEPPPGGAPCEGEACRGLGTSPPASSGAGTAVFEGSGNVGGVAACPKGKRKATVKGRTVCKKRKVRKQHRDRGRHGRRAGSNRGAGK